MSEYRRERAGLSYERRFCVSIHLLKLEVCHFLLSFTGLVYVNTTVLLNVDKTIFPGFRKRSSPFRT